MAGPHDMSSNDLLCSILWHVVCLVRHRSESESGMFYLPLDLRQMHAPDAYFGNAQCVLKVQGESSGMVECAAAARPKRDCLRWS